MKDEKEIKISVPDGYEIDKKNSTFECIKFKPVVKKWRDNKDELLEGYFIDQVSRIQHVPPCYNNTFNNNIFVTEKHAKSALAMAQISQIMANDKRFGGAITDEEWANEDIVKYCIIREYGSSIMFYTHFRAYEFLTFHTKEQRELFLKENKDLVKDYLMID